jgi:acetyl-CoA synthetase
MTAVAGSTVREAATRLAKPPGRTSNLGDYAARCAAFSWADARALLDGLPDGGLNIAHEAVIRHARGASADHVALLWLGRHGERRAFTYRALAAEIARFANVLRGLGVAPGDRIFVMLGRVPELYVAVLGGLLAKAVVSPLFSAFGPEPILTRLRIGQGKVLVTSPELYTRKVAQIREQANDLAHVLVTGTEAPAGTTALQPRMEAAADRFPTPPTAAEDMALLHFTSGTTGTPKGAMHVHEAVVAHHVTGLYALDFRPGDVFWCTADPGWVTGTSYGIIAPLTNGVTNLVLEAEFDAALWYQTLAAERVTVWYTAPTAIRMLMKAGKDALQGHDLSRLRFMSSVGEPLNPEAVIWGQEAFGQPFHDNWWQTETGGIMIANYLSMDVKPGSMGRPLPGIEAGVARHLPGGGIEPVDEPMVEGELVLKTGWPSMMRGYLGEEARYRKCFAGEWYLTGDLAKRDEEGYYWFVGRADDVIKTSGHLIGPFEVESILIEHSAVAEAAVIGVPDPTAGELIKAFVALKPGHEPDEALRRDILGHARKRLGAAVAPKLIDFKANLPKTRSGKIMRRLLKARELGLPEGDLSTLESDEQ